MWFSPISQCQPWPERTFRHNCPWRVWIYLPLLGQYFRWRNGFDPKASDCQSEKTVHSWPNIKAFLDKISWTIQRNGLRTLQYSLRSSFRTFTFDIKLINPAKPLKAQIYSVKWLWNFSGTSWSPKISKNGTLTTLELSHFSLHISLLCHRVVSVHSSWRDFTVYTSFFLTVQMIKNFIFICWVLLSSRSQKISSAGVGNGRFSGFASRLVFL